MTDLLIGSELSADLFRINAQLREATVVEYNKQAKLKVPSYSPWLGMFPCVDDGQLPSQLLKEPVFVRGGLVSDEAYLGSCRAFMEHRPEMTRNGIYDQAHIDWIPITEVNKRQEMVFARGRELLLGASPMFARMYLEFVDYVVLLGGQRNRGFSCHTTRGIIFRTLPETCDEYDVAIDLAHELGHQGLFVLQSIDPILESDPMYMIYSQIRRTLRPAIQTFHAAVALAFMHHFVSLLKDDPACQAAGQRRGQQYTESLRKSLWLSIQSMEAECRFTPIGTKILNEMRALT